MSFIVKGVDLPKKGSTVRIVVYENGLTVFNKEYWGEDGEKHFDTTYEAQVIQIDRPHGRLIDGDKLKLARHDVYVEEINYRHRCIHIENIDEAPTILEAEEENLRLHREERTI